MARFFGFVYFRQKMDLSSDDILNERFESFISLNSLDKYFEEEEIENAIDVHSIRNGNEAIFTIISEEELINVKVTINHPSSDSPLSFKSPTRIKNVSGKKFTHLKWISIN